MNTLVDVSLKKINVYGNRKKLHLLNYFKGKSIKNLLSERKSLSQKIKKIIKVRKNYFFGNIRVFTELLEHSENTPLELIELEDFASISISSIG